ncbi:LysE family translocator [Pseudomonas nicosulfuronedens]
MPSLESLSLFFIATLALNLTPGPDMLYVASRSAAQGAAAGLMSTLGIGAGCVVHMLAAAFGLSALLMMSSVAFGVLKWLGAIYLVWLGVQLIRGAWREQKRTELEPARLSRVFLQGMMVNVFNPKVALFFLAFLPQFVPAGSPNFVLQILCLGLLFNLGGCLVNAVVSLVAGRVGNRVGSNLAWRRWQQTASGGLIVAMGVGLAVSSRR